MVVRETTEDLYHDCKLVHKPLTPQIPLCLHSTIKRCSVRSPFVSQINYGIMTDHSMINSCLVVVNNHAVGCEKQK